MFAVALPDFVVSATEVALMFTMEGLGATAGAVYMPDALIIPTLALLPSDAVAVHVTAVLVVPVTVAVNCAVPLGATVTETGETETVMFEVEEELLEPELPPFPPQATAKVARKRKIVFARDDLLNNFQVEKRAARFKSLSSENSA